MSIFTIVVTYNGMEWLPDCLHSLKNSVKETGIIVVDNASQDETSAYLRRDHPDVILIEPNENIGFAKANNLGIRYALAKGAEAVFLLNQDAVTAPETIGTLVDAADNYPQFGIFSPLHLNGAGTALDSGFCRYLLEDLEKIRSATGCSLSTIDLSKLRGCSEILLPVNFVNAASWLITRDCLKQAGGFCPLFFMYGEDLEYSRRAAAAGFQTAVVPSAEIRHFRDQKSESPAEWSLSWELTYFERSLLLLFLHPFLTRREKLLRLYLLWNRGLRRLLFSAPWSIFPFYGKKFPLFFRSMRLYRTLEPPQSWRFLSPTDDNGFSLPAESVPLHS